MPVPVASTGPRPRGRGWKCLPLAPGSETWLQRSLDHLVEDGRRASRSRSPGSGFNGASTTWSRMAPTVLYVNSQELNLQRGVDHVVEDGAAPAQEHVGCDILQRGLEH